MNNKPLFANTLAVCSLFRFPKVEKNQFILLHCLRKIVSVISVTVGEKHISFCYMSVLQFTCIWSHLLPPDTRCCGVLHKLCVCVCVCVCVCCLCLFRHGVSSKPEEGSRVLGGWLAPAGRSADQSSSCPVDAGGGRTDTRVPVSSPTRRTQQDDPAQRETHILSYMQLVGTAGGLLYSGSWFDHAACCCV